ncbi:MAG TPA: class I SAM-dependent methyltransferase [Spirochaetia bacterium]|nr:class I SAM-dependent methyltransferase [Spirochaetia bacterium]
MKGDLWNYFENNQGRKIDKWVHHFEIYERYFSKYRNLPVNVLEIGVDHGGSLQMWKHYFGDTAQIFGLDINSHCKSLEEDRIKIFIGDQGNKEFLRSLKQELPKIHILIDDGGHTMSQQITTFEELFPHIVEDGIYLCEDVCTSYWNEFGGGYKNSNTFIEHSKNLIDYLNAWYSRESETFNVNDFTRSAHSMHYYASVLVIEKCLMTLPQRCISGKPSF